MGKVDIWMPVYINDYLGDTMHLEAESHGIYLLLMFHYWKKGPLGKCENKLMRIARTNDSELLNEILYEFFTDNGETYTHKRVEDEKTKANSRRDSASLNGKKGGRPSKSNNPQETHGFNKGIPTDNPKGNPQESSSSSPSPSQSNTQSPAPVIEKPKRASRFTPPTILEVKNYCWERKNKVDAERFIDHYSSNGWMVGKNKMKDWKAAVRTWEKNDYSSQPKNAKAIVTEFEEVAF